MFNKQFQHVLNPYFATDSSSYGIPYIYFFYAPLCFSKLFLVFSLLKLQQHFLSMSRGKSVINYHIGWTFEASASLGNFHLVSNSNISFETPNTKLEWPKVLVIAPFTYVSYTGLTQTNLKDCKQPWAQDFWVFISDSHYFFTLKSGTVIKLSLEQSLFAVTFLFSSTNLWNVVICWTEFSATGLISFHLKRILFLRKCCLDLVTKPCIKLNRM